MSSDDNLVRVVFRVRKTCFDPFCTKEAVRIVPVTATRPGRARLELRGSIPTELRGTSTWIAHASLPMNTVLRYKVAVVKPSDGSLIRREKLYRKLHIKREPVLVKLKYNDPDVRISVLKPRLHEVADSTCGFNDDRDISKDSYIVTQSLMSTDHCQYERNNSSRVIHDQVEPEDETYMHPRLSQKGSARGRQKSGGSNRSSQTDEHMWPIHLMHPSGVFDLEDSSEDENESTHENEMHPSGVFDLEDENENTHQNENTFHRFVGYLLPLGVGAVFGLALYNNWRNNFKVIV